MNYNLNVLVMLCYKISTIFFESNSLMFLKSDAFQESEPQAHRPKVGTVFRVRVCWKGGKALTRDLQWRLLGRGCFLRTQCVYWRRSQVKRIYQNDKTGVRGTCDPEKELFAAFYRVAKAGNMTSEELQTQQPSFDINPVGI